MNKAYKYTLTANEHKEITFDVGVQRLAVTNANGEDGSGVTYTAGDNIQISEENVISATDTTYTAGDGIAISEQNVISNTAKGNTDIIAEEYDRYKSYNIGDYCIYNNKLYKCLNQIESTEWYTQLNFQQGSVRTTYEFINGSGKFGFYKSGNYYYVIACTTDNNAVVERTHYQSGFEPNVFQIALTDAYTGIVESGFYNRNSIGSYTSPHDDYFNSQNDALYDFFSRPYFDSSKWTEVTVTDEIKHYRYCYSTDEHVVGTWINGKDIYERTIIFIGVSRGRYQISHNIPNIEFVVGYEYIFDQSPSDPEWFRSLPEAVTDLYAIFVSGVSATQIDYRYGTSWSVDPDLYITIRYTKTTN